MGYSRLRYLGREGILGSSFFADWLRSHAQAFRRRTGPWPTRCVGLSILPSASRRQHPHLRNLPAPQLQHRRQRFLWICHRSRLVFAKPANLAKRDGGQGARTIRNILMPVPVGVVLDAEPSAGRSIQERSIQERRRKESEREMPSKRKSVFSSLISSPLLVVSSFSLRNPVGEREGASPFWRDVVWQTEKVWKNTPCPLPASANPAKLANTSERGLSQDSQHSHGLPATASRGKPPAQKWGRGVHRSVSRNWTPLRP